MSQRLAFGLSELGWQAACRRPKPTASRRLWVLWGFVELFVLALLGGFFGGVIGVVVLRCLWRWRHGDREAPRQATPALPDERAWLVLLPAGIYAVFLVVVMSRWDVFPRYALPLLVPAMLLVFAAARGARASWVAPSVALALFLAYAWVRTDLYVAQIVATEGMRERLVADGIPAKQIRAGLELDGWHWRWHCLDHPDEGGTTPVQKTWPHNLTPALIENYVITDSRAPWSMDLAGYELLRQEAFRARLWPVPRPLYVMRRVPLLSSQGQGGPP